MTSFHHRHPIGNIDSLLRPLSDLNPTGQNLYYDSLYDTIKDARREDDPTLSQGVWQMDLKKADWTEVEDLCCQALREQTKDLQIAIWLGEAWISLDHWEGMERSIHLIKDLSDSYWDDFYPREDMDRRIHLYEWLDSTFKNRAVKIPLCQNPLTHSPLTLSDWMQASRLETVSKRSPDRQKILKKAESNNEMTFSKIHQILQTCPKNTLETLQKKAMQIITLYEGLKKSLDSLFTDGQRPSMSLLPETFKELHRFLKMGMELSPNSTDSVHEDPLLPLPFSETITQIEASPPPSPRVQAYQTIAEVSRLLQRIEPHSPTPALLKRIVSWEHKSISEIFKDFGESPSDWTIFTKFLGFSDSLKKE